MEARTYRNSVVGSLIIHGLAAALVILLTTFPPVRSVSELTPVIVELEKMPPIPEERSRTVVQSVSGEKTETPLKNAYLGQESRIVDRETTAKNQIVSPRAGAVASRPKTSAESRGVLSKFGVPLFPQGNQERKAQAPQWVDYRGVFGEAGADYVKGLKESEQSALNTREFAYYSYFQRVRVQLDRAWQTLLKENVGKLYRSGRTLASDMDHTTKTIVTLSSRGEVTRVQVLEESGTRDLDNAAIDAFNKAGPFPNPPKDMVDPTGQIQIRWDFVLKT